MPRKRQTWYVTNGGDLVRCTWADNNWLRSEDGKLNFYTVSEGSGGEGCYAKKALALEAARGIVRRAIARLRGDVAHHEARLAQLGA